jgi:hypothetical protein
MDFRTIPEAPTPIAGERVLGVPHPGKQERALHASRTQTNKQRNSITTAVRLSEAYASVA